MSQLAQVIRNVVRVAWQMALPVPMPWRASLIILLALLLLYHVGWRLLGWAVEKLGYLLLYVAEAVASLLLLHEYAQTKRLRQNNRDPLPGSYLLGDALQGVVGFIHQSTGRWVEARSQWKLGKGWIVLLLLASVPVVLGYMRSGLEDTTAAARYIDQAVAWWTSLESQVLISN